MDNYTFMNEIKFMFDNPPPSKRDFIPQRGIDFTDEATHPLLHTCLTLGWEKLATHENSFCPQAVREFYSNLGLQLAIREDEPILREITSVWVRGKLVPFSREVIIQTLNLVDTPQYLRKYMPLYPNPAEICQSLSAPDDGWNFPDENSADHTYDAASLPESWAVWNLFVHRNIIPSPNDTKISEQRMVLLHNMKQGNYIDVPQRIFRSIIEAARHLDLGLCFPQLLTEIIRNANVDVVSIGMSQFEENPPISLRTLPAAVPKQTSQPGHSKEAGTADQDERAFD